MSRSYLVLYAASPEVAPAPQRLISLLTSCGFLGPSVDDQAFLAGDRFFQFVSFLGCSPSIALLPGQGDDYLRIDIRSFSSPRLLTAPRTHTPSCRSCGEVFPENWKTIASAAGVLKCASCAEMNSLARLNFRRRACYSRCVIRISPVFESEAIPSPQLLQLLMSEFDVSFQHAYI